MAEPLPDDDLLKSVSRTFYLSMVWLPQEMRPAISLGYLLARATDSVADSSSADVEQRLKVLREMEHAVAGELSESASRELLETLAGGMAEAQTNPAERRLLQRFGECLQMAEALPDAQLRLIRKVLHTIVEGQVWDLTYFTPERPAVETDDMTRQYTYWVAGCVGEFWTELGYETLGARFCLPEQRELMNRAGIRFGQGLQLINILRDIREDAARGRAYLCSDEWVWQNRAERYLNDGLSYASRLGGFRLRFTVMLPALLGLRTLELIRVRKNQARVKIPRRMVYGSMLKAAWLSAWRRAF